MTDAQKVILNHQNWYVIFSIFSLKSEKYVLVTCIPEKMPEINIPELHKLIYIQETWLHRMTQYPVDQFLII